LIDVLSLFKQIELLYRREFFSTSLFRLISIKIGKMFTKITVDKIDIDCKLTSLSQVCVDVYWCVYSNAIRIWLNSKMCDN